MQNLATNRQKKLLRFFNIRFSPNISNGAAGWEIASLLADDERRERWRKYLYLTKDFDSETDKLQPYDVSALSATVVPEDWHSSKEIQHFKDELVANLLGNEAPYDNPQPEIQFAGRTFAFTGKFNFGSRKECQSAVNGVGGIAAAKPAINRNLDYLVIGTQGSPDYKMDSYGSKIEKAILSRREFGSPAVISEDHWAQEMTKKNVN